MDMDRVDHTGGACLLLHDAIGVGIDRSFRDHLLGGHLAGITDGCHCGGVEGIGMFLFIVERGRQLPFHTLRGLSGEFIQKAQGDGLSARNINFRLSHGLEQHRIDHLAVYDCFHVGAVLGSRRGSDLRGTSHAAEGQLARILLNVNDLGVGASPGHSAVRAGRQGLCKQVGIFNEARAVEIVRLALKKLLRFFLFLELGKNLKFFRLGNNFDIKHAGGDIRVRGFDCDGHRAQFGDVRRCQGGGVAPGLQSRAQLVAVVQAPVESLTGTVRHNPCGEAEGLSGKDFILARCAYYLHVFGGDPGQIAAIAAAGNFRPGFTQSGVVDRCYRAGKGILRNNGRFTQEFQPGQGRAVLKGIRLNFLDRIGNADGCQIPAILEGSLLNRRQIFRQIQFIQIAVVVQCVGTNGLHAVGDTIVASIPCAGISNQLFPIRAVKHTVDRIEGFIFLCHINGLQAAHAVEGALAQGRDTGGDGDFGHLAASGEGVGTDVGHALTDFDIGDVIAVLIPGDAFQSIQRVIVHGAVAGNLQGIMGGKFPGNAGGQIAVILCFFRKLGNGEVAEAGEDERGIPLAALFVDVGTDAVHQFFNFAVLLVVQDHQEIGVDAIGHGDGDLDGNRQVLRILHVIQRHGEADRHRVIIGRIQHMILFRLVQDQGDRVGGLCCRIVQIGAHDGNLVAVNRHLVAHGLGLGRW